MLETGKRILKMEFLKQTSLVQKLFKIMIKCNTLTTINTLHLKTVALV